MDIFQDNPNFQVISSVSTQPPPTNSPNFPPLLIYGGVTVAVIIALTYYNKISLKSITKLISTNRKDK